MTGSIVQISISNGGVPKRPIEQAEVGELGVHGDRQRDTRHHGGPERALCLFALENIQAMQADGHPVAPGSTGENITTTGLDWSAIVPGTRLRLGSEVRIEVTNYTSPCSNLTPFFSDGDFNRMNAKLHPANSRVYARVLQGGAIHTGDPIEVISPEV